MQPGRPRGGCEGRQTGPQGARCAPTAQCTAGAQAVGRDRAGPGEGMGGPSAVPWSLLPLLSLSAEGLPEQESSQPRTGQGWTPEHWGLVWALGPQLPLEGSNAPCCPFPLPHLCVRGWCGPASGAQGRARTPWQVSVTSLGLGTFHMGRPCLSPFPSEDPRRKALRDQEPWGRSLSSARQ